MPVDLLLSLLLLIGLIAHILFKPSLGAARQKLGSHRWPIRFYLRCYHALTLAFLSLLLCLFVLWSVKSGLIILLILIVVPSIAYLFMNSRDLTKGTFMERFVCVCLLLFLAVGLIGWPHLYGKRVFEPKFFEVTFAGDRPNRCDQSRYKTGPVLLAYQKNGKEMFCQICLGDDTKYIHFFDHSGAKPLGGGEVTLSSVATHFVPPVQRGEGEEAIADIREQLRAAGVVDP